jgi:cell division inhibitor SepF
MASLWQKTLFYLGLVDDEDAEAPVDQPPQQARVRTVEPPRSRSSRAGGEPSPPAQPTSRPTGGVAGRRVEPPDTQRRRVSSNPQHAEAGVIVRGNVEQLVPRPAPSADECEIIEARSFTDAQFLADHIREGRPVVLDLRGTEPAMVRRLVDFSTGLTYALDGRMAKIAQGVILVTPHGTSLSTDEQARLADLGLYQVNR